jgi:hypothetical protein
MVETGRFRALWVNWIQRVQPPPLRVPLSAPGPPEPTRPPMLDMKGRVVARYTLHLMANFETRFSPHRFQGLKPGACKRYGPTGFNLGLGFRV